jgi:hypothetical protein
MLSTPRSSDVGGEQPVPRLVEPLAQAMAMAMPA